MSIERKLGKMKLKLEEDDRNRMRVGIEPLVKRSKIIDNRLYVTFYIDVEWKVAQQHLAKLFGYLPIPVIVHAIVGCKGADHVKYDWYVEPSFAEVEKYESPIQSLLESLQSDFANTASPKGSLEIEQMVVDGFLAHQLQQEKEITVRGVLRKVSEFEK